MVVEVELISDEWEQGDEGAAVAVEVCMGQ